MTSRRQFFARMASILGGCLLFSKIKAEEYKPITVKLPEPSKIDRVVFLWAIAQVESGDRAGAVGTAGERGKYQLSSLVIQQHLGHTEAVNDAQLAFVARRHFAWLNQNIPRQSLTEIYEREYALAFAWNAGLETWNSVSAGRVWSSKDALHHAYARAVQNLYHDRIKTLRT